MNQTLRIRTTRFSAVFFIFCSGTRRLASAFVADGLARWPSTLRSSYTTDARCHAAATPEASSGVPELAERIYELAGRRFDIGKPAVLAKVGTRMLLGVLCLSNTVMVLVLRAMPASPRYFTIEIQGKVLLYI